MWRPQHRGRRLPDLHAANLDRQAAERDALIGREQRVALDHVDALGAERERVEPSLDLVQPVLRKGVHVARRTVAKYREAMRIPSSAERRRLESQLADARSRAEANYMTKRPG